MIHIMDPLDPNDTNNHELQTVDIHTSHENNVIRQLEIMDFNMKLLYNKIKVMTDTQNVQTAKIAESIEKLDKRLDRIEDFEKSITGSWKGIMLTVIVIWAAFGDKVKTFFH